MRESLRGLFYIMKGQYVKNRTPRFWNDVSESDNYIGGYDPEGDDTSEWYSVMDKENFQCHGTAPTLKGAVNIIRKIILRYRTKEHLYEVLERYDMPKSPIHIRLMEEVYNTYGDFFSGLVEDVENTTYEEVRNDTPVMRARNKRKRSLIKVEMKDKDTPPDTTIEDTPPKGDVPKKRNKGLKIRKRKVSVEM